ncbi:MAG: sigma 54-dependent Fis family transcriptional regulator [Deltaproteobacteria bacterium]|nr:sigma 54-dependent Fis family transcriptional regulator [Deltaproteobacteria bacterium]
MPTGNPGGTDIKERIPLAKDAKLRVLVLGRERQARDFDVEVLIVGKGDDCDIRITSDKWISSRHLKLQRVPHGARVVDLQSSNGTFLMIPGSNDDGSRITETILSPGGLSLRAGETELRLELTQGSATDAGDFCGITGQTDSMKAVFAAIDARAPFNMPVVFFGETGTGKEGMARAVHARSLRRNRPFIVVNCAGLSESMMESQLFGHVKGAFTGAVKDRKGSFEQADGGTLFLDEIGDMPLSIQAKLLRAVEQGEFQKLGGEDIVHVDVRLVAASNKDLRQLVRDGRFAHDFYHRLGSSRIELPALVDRLDDLPLLAQRFIREFAGGREVKLSALAEQKLRAHPWSGNVRELRNALELAVAKLKGRSLVQAEDIELDDLDLRPLLRLAPNRLEGLDTLTMAEVKAYTICAAILRTDGDRTAASELLGIGRNATKGYPNAEQLRALDADGLRALLKKLAAATED